MTQGMLLCVREQKASDSSQRDNFTTYSISSSDCHQRHTPAVMPARPRRRSQPPHVLTHNKIDHLSAPASDIFAFGRLLICNDTVNISMTPAPRMTYLDQREATPFFGVAFAGVGSPQERGFDSLAWLISCKASGALNVRRKRSSVMHVAPTGRSSERARSL